MWKVVARLLWSMCILTTNVLVYALVPVGTVQVGYCALLCVYLVGGKNMKFNELPEEDRFRLQYMLGENFVTTEQFVHFLLYDKINVGNKNVLPSKRYKLTVDIEVEALT